MARSPRFSKVLYGQLVELIRNTAENLRSTDPDYKGPGLRNGVIVTAMLDEAMRLGRREHREMMAMLLARIVPSVLGVRPDESEMPLILPGLEMPDWFNVPAPEESKEPAGWKKDRDVTPDEIERIIEHRRQDIIGRTVEMNKFTLLRATALELGCAPDKPISTVFPEPKPPEPPEVRPPV